MQKERLRLMADLGFEIHGRFYGLVRFEDWLMSDFVLARKLTGVSTDELLSRSADSMLLQETLVAVAIAHERRELNMEQVVDYVYALKPIEVKEIGFDVIEGDASPPEEGEDQVQNLSSENSNTSTDPAPDSTTPDPSGLPGSDTGSPE
jgi:hypothetical protein